VIIRKSAREIEGMAAAGAVIAGALALLEESLEPGISMIELDKIADDYIAAHGSVPTSKGYKGFPAATCISPNEMIVHGIPGPYELKDGDVISLDVGVTLKGWVGDSAITVRVGAVPDEATRLLETCRLSLFDAIEACVPGGHLSDVGAAVQARVEGAGFGVVRALVGHGVGRKMHEDPQVPNYGVAGRGPQLAPGMVFAIEPMITAGDHAIQPDAEDGWSIYTADGSLASHFEHTVAVTEDGPLVLTRHEGWSPVDDVVA
jgi:methionyl aminopeptidase